MKLKIRNYCQDCESFDIIGNYEGIGYCNNDLVSNNMDDLKPSGVALIDCHPIKLIVTSSYGCVNFEKKEVKE